MNLEQLRFNMIEQQIRPWDVLDPKVLDLLKVVRREQFVPAESKALAFVDVDVPLGHGVAMWQPKLEARAVQALDIQPTDNVLEIGTGSGHLTALLARLAGQVTSVEIVPELSTAASRNLATHHISNVTLQVGDAPAMQAQLTTRVAADKFETKVLFETAVAPLQNATQPQRFVF